MTRAPLTTELALLGFLRQQPMHGYEIHQTLAERAGLGRVWRIKQSKLYALLGKLEKHRYVTTTLEPQEGRPARKVYHLTATGKAAFLGWVQSPVQRGRRLRLDFLLKLYFARQEGLAESLLARQREACQGWVAEQHTQLAGLAEHQLYDKLVHEFRLGQMQAMLDWLTTCEALIKEQPA